MSITTIEAALEKRLLAMTPALPTAAENKTYTPVTGVPYQRVHHLTNAPVDLSLERGLMQERGIMQISLFYPLDQGRVPAKLRAQAVRNSFRPPQIVTEGGIDIEITRTPTIGSGMPDGDRYMVPVSIYWQAFIAT